MDQPQAQPSAPQQPQVRTIQDTEFTFYILEALPAWPVWLRLQKLSVPPMLQVLRAGVDVELDVAAIARAVAHLVIELQTEDLERVVLPLLGKVTRNGVPVGGTDDRGRKLFTQAFAGRYGLLMEVLATAIEVNFLDFYIVLKRTLHGAANALAALAPPKTQGPSASAAPETTPAPA